MKCGAGSSRGDSSGRVSEKAGQSCVWLSSALLRSSSCSGISINADCFGVCLLCGMQDYDHMSRADFKDGRYHLTRNPLDFWGANIPSAAGGGRAVCSVSLSVPETLTCDVVFSCPRVRLSGAKRDARPTQCPAHSCLQQLWSGVVLGWGWGERVPWSNEAQALLCALHVHLAIMSLIK